VFLGLKNEVVGAYAPTNLGYSSKCLRPKSNITFNTSHFGKSLGLEALPLTKKR
jgi:hypothetical protein